VFGNNRGRKIARNMLATAIDRATAKAGVPRFAPNQIRHAAATRIRRQFGLEAAQVILGHSNMNTTEIYAEKNVDAAVKIARDCG
jgi:site-specific recombinase XerD